MIYAHMVDCLTHEQCDEIIACAEKLEMERAVVLLHNGGVGESDIRTNYQTRLPNPIAQMAHKAINEAVVRWGQRIKDLYPQVVGTSQMPGHTHNLDTEKEHINILKYTGGEKYSWHVDQSFNRKPTERLNSNERLISTVVYLNDNFEGGETEMPEKIWRPKKGKALIFPSHWTFPHQGRPVTKGTKYALVTWFHPA